MNKAESVTAHVTRRTVNGAPDRRDCQRSKMLVRFSRSRNTVYLANGVVLTRVKGGHRGGVLRGQYQCEKTDDMYDVTVW